MNGTVADATAVMQNFSAINNNCAPIANPSFTGTALISGSLAGYVFYDRANTENLWEWYSEGNTVELYKNFNTAGNLMSIDEGGAVTLSGSLAGYVFSDRTNAGNVWEWYSDGNTAGLYKGFNTAGTVMSVDQNGNVGIGTTTPGYPLQINGNAFANSWQTPSDARLKKNISPISDALATIQHLQGIRFEWRGARERLVGKTLDLPTDEPQIGFIAQEVETVLPEAVSTAKGDGLMSVQESKIVPVLVEAVKELKAANDHQAGEITKLRTEIGELRRWKEKAAATN